MRAGELADLDADAVVRIGTGHWLRIPLGKLRNDRYVPLHPELVQLLAAWTAANLEHIRRHKRLVADHRGVLDRHIIGRIVRRAGRAAGVPGVHPHRLRHTLATQAKRRGVASDATFRLRREAGAVGDGGPGTAGWRSRRQSEPAGQVAVTGQCCARCQDVASSLVASDASMMR